MKILFASLALSLTCAAPLQAQWANTEWVLDQTRSAYACTFCSPEDLAYATAHKSALTAIQASVAPELRAISEWMSSMSFVQANLPTAPAPFFVVALRGRPDTFKENLLRSVASYESSTGIELSYKAFITNLSPDGTYSPDTMLENSTTLAHEVYHGVQRAQHPKGPDDTWFSESVPEAVGRAWANKKYGTLAFNAPDYTRPLHKPDGIYDRDHFFYYTGEMLAAHPTISYVKELDAESGYDGHDGLQWLDNFLTQKSAPLADFYPQLIASYAPTAAYFSATDRADATAKTYSPKTEIPTGTPSVTKIDSEPRQILGVATTYTEAAAHFSGAWSALDDQDRIYVNILKIHEAERMNEARLIVSSTLVPQGGRYLSPVFADQGTMKTPLRTRVANVAQTPYNSSPQAVRLSLETAQVNFTLPACLSAGQTVPIEIDGPLTTAEAARLFGSGPARLRPSAGTLNADFTYTAPAGAQTVSFSLTLPTIGDGTHRVKLAPITISPKGCMVRMRAGRSVMTYSAEPEYVEAGDTKSKSAMYFNADDMATFDKGGWKKIPAQAKAMLLGRMRKSIALGKATDGFQMHNMPKTFSTRFSWAELRRTTAPGGGKPQRTPAPCPDAGTGCSTTTFLIEGHPVPVVFDASGQPLRVTLEGQNFTFEYGGFDIRRPPGW